MEKCSPSYTTKNLRPSADCKRECSGQGYSLVSMTTSELEHGCKFEWTVKDSEGKTTSGSTLVSCGQSSSQKFLCDDDAACPIFEIIMTCSES